MDQAQAFHYPSLRSAAWLYLFVILGTVLVIGLQTNIEILFLRFLVALLIVAGLTALTLLITRTPIGAVLGRGPGIGGLLSSLLAGILLWLPAAWLIILGNGLLTLSLGRPPDPQPLGTGATQAALIIQFGLVIPLCQGFLFWAYIQRAAEGLGRVRGAWLTAGLFACFGLISTEFGLSILPAYFLIGLAAALAGHFTQSAWSGIAVLIGYSLTRALFENTPVQADLFNALGAEAAEDLVNVRWLLAVALSLFVVFVLLQILRALKPQGDSPPRAAPRAWWWLPLLVSLGVYLVLGYGELAVRAASR